MTSKEFKDFAAGMLLGAAIAIFFNIAFSKFTTETEYERGYEEGFEFGRVVGKGEAVNMLIKIDSI